MTGKKIMIVDDDEGFLEELTDMLSATGYETVPVNEGASVFGAACSVKPDLILLDLKMEGKDGFQVTEELKQAPETEQIPIIAMTGYFTKEEHSKLVSMCGMDAYLIKPFNPLDIICRIETVLLSHNNKENK